MQSLQMRWPVAAHIGLSMVTMASAPMMWPPTSTRRSEEHTSELQSHSDLVCRLLLEKKKTTMDRYRVLATISGSTVTFNSNFRITDVEFHPRDNQDPLIS